MSTRKYIGWCFGMLLCVQTQAQDIHFSEFFATPLFTNPALTGHFDGTYRFAGVVRRQWASISTEPYQTFGGSVDMNAPLNIKPLGVGLQLSWDQTGVSALTTSQITVPLSLEFRLGSAKNLTWGFAGNVSLLQLSIDYSKLSFGEQFNGIRYDETIPISEQFPGNSASGINASLGTYLEKKISERQRFGIGYSLFNLTQPNVSFSSAMESRIPHRHNVHVLSSFPIGSSWDIMPAGQVMFQGIHSEYVAGTAFRYHMANKRSVQAGVWGRLGDAGYLSLGMQRDNLFAGVSYDFNLSNLHVASGYLGGWEFSVIYTIETVREKVKRTRICPDYL